MFKPGAPVGWRENQSADDVMHGVVLVGGFVESIAVKACCSFQSSL